MDLKADNAVRWFCRGRKELSPAEALDAILRDRRAGREFLALYAEEILFFWEGHCDAQKDTDDGGGLCAGRPVRYI